MNDLRHALRQAALRPTFSATVILMLALGIGATTAMFSLFRTVVLSPLVALLLDDAQRSAAREIPRLRSFGRLAHAAHGVLGYELPRPQGPREHRVSKRRVFRIARV